jgi:hypothetical protein
MYRIPNDAVIVHQRFSISTFAIPKKGSTQAHLENDLFLISNNKINTVVSNKANFIALGVSNPNNTTSTLYVTKSTFPIAPEKKDAVRIKKTNNPLSLLDIQYNVSKSFNYPIFSIAFDSSSKYLAIGSKGFITIFNINTNETYTLQAPNINEPIEYIAWINDGRTIMYKTTNAILQWHAPKHISDLMHKHFNPKLKEALIAIKKSIYSSPIKTDTKERNI